MIVYVESNFILELALAQEQAQAVEAILALAEQRAITLVVPAFALSEPFANVRRRTNERNRLLDVLRPEVRELGRSTTHQPVAAQLQPALALLAAVGAQQTAALLGTVSRLLRAGMVANLDGATFEQAALFQESYGLSARTPSSTPASWRTCAGANPRSRSALSAAMSAALTISASNASWSSTPAALSAILPMACAISRVCWRATPNYDRHPHPPHTTRPAARYPVAARAAGLQAVDPDWSALRCRKHAAWTILNPD